jgi:GNAT superfamily N-acetyltransferase
LERCEDYLRRRGARVIYGGGIRPLNAFYLGLYGGSEMPGVLESDVVAQRVYTSHGYREIDRTLVFRRELGDFEAPIDRRQMQVRRQVVVEVTNDPPARTWWEACTLGEFDLTRFDAVPRTGGAPVASATFRTMGLVPSGGPSRSMGLIDIWVEESFRRHGLAVFLLCEAFRQFARQGTETIDIQAMQHNLGALGLYRKLGFQQVGQGSVFRKEVS